MPFGPGSYPDSNSASFSPNDCPQAPQSTTFIPPHTRNQSSFPNPAEALAFLRDTFDGMALIQTTLIWVVYAVVVALLVLIASVFVYVYQTPRERSISVSIVSIFTLTSLLATVLLLPVDVALVSSTTSSKLGRRKDWATQNAVDDILLTLKIVYYTLYSLDALLCLLVVPFTYFWYEEYDEVAAEEGTQTFGSKFWGAFKYTLAFIILVIILFLVGFFVPVARDRKGGHYDLDFFKRILEENREYLHPRWNIKGPSLIALFDRRGASLDICAWVTHYYWNIDIRFIYGRWLCFAASGFHQVCSRSICTYPQRQHGF